MWGTFRNNRRRVQNKNAHTEFQVVKNKVYIESRCAIRSRKSTNCGLFFQRIQTLPSDGSGEPVEEVEGGFLTMEGRSQHLSLLVQPRLHTMSNIWSWNCGEETRTRCGYMCLWLSDRPLVFQRLNVQLADDVIGDVSHSN